MEPLTTSHLYKGTLHEKFYQQGTDDQTNFFAVPAAINYHKSLGFDALYSNADELLEYARKRLCTGLLRHFQPQLTGGFTRWKSSLSSVACHTFTFTARTYLYNTNVNVITVV